MAVDVRHAPALGRADASLEARAPKADRWSLSCSFASPREPTTYEALNQSGDGSLNLKGEKGEKDLGRLG